MKSEVGIDKIVNILESEVRHKREFPFLIVYPQSERARALARFVNCRCLQTLFYGERLNGGRVRGGKTNLKLT